MANPASSLVSNPISPALSVKSGGSTSTSYSTAAAVPAAGSSGVAAPPPPSPAAAAALSPALVAHGVLLVLALTVILPAAACAARYATSLPGRGSTARVTSGPAAAYKRMESRLQLLGYALAVIGSIIGFAYAQPSTVTAHGAVGFVVFAGVVVQALWNA